MSTQEPLTQDAVLASPQAKASSSWRSMARIGKEALVLIVIVIVFVVPFIFIVLTAAKTRQEAALLQFSMPSSFNLLDNFREVMTFGNGRMARALSLIHISEPTRPY